MTRMRLTRRRKSHGCSQNSERISTDEKRIMANLRHNIQRRLQKDLTMLRAREVLASRSAHSRNKTHPGAVQFQLSSTVRASRRLSKKTVSIFVKLLMAAYAQHSLSALSMSGLAGRSKRCACRSARAGKTKEPDQPDRVVVLLASHAQRGGCTIVTRLRDAAAKSQQHRLRSRSDSTTADAAQRRLTTAITFR